MSKLSDEQVIHDLSIAFASQKLNYALNNSIFEDGVTSDGILNYDYFLNEYQSARDYYISCGTIVE